jgi:hypothetical protein
MSKEKIIQLFMTNVKGKEIKIMRKNQMKIKHNCKSEPDIFGYEMKKNAKKITFGDISANEYLFSKNKQTIEKLNNWNENEHTITRNEFIKYFGKSNPKKNNRYSWSGSCVPNYGVWNDFGQILLFDDNSNLFIKYSFEKDTRSCKIDYPIFLHKNDIIIAMWKCEKLEKHINIKYNNKGFFICKKNDDKYDKICFGKPFDYNYFVDNIKKRNIIFDSGMYVGNNRNYSHFRSLANNFWFKLIVEEY